MMKEYIKKAIDAYHTLDNSVLFDKKYYEKKYHVPASISVIYDLMFGHILKNDPSENFSAKRYYEAYPDVANSKLPALYHYLKHGIYEGRVYEDSNPEYTYCPLLYLFDGGWYATQYMQNNSDNLSALQHYLTIGYKKGYKPFAEFDIKKFYEHNSQCASEPLSFWFEKRLGDFYLTDIVSLVYDMDSRKQRALQYIYHFVQDKRLDKICEHKSKPDTLSLFFTPDLGKDPQNRFFCFQKSYFKFESESSSNVQLVAATMPGTTTFTGDGVFNSQLNVYRYSQIAYKFKDYSKVIFSVSDDQLCNFYEHLNYNRDDCAHQCRKKELRIVNYHRVGDISNVISLLSPFFEHIMCVEQIDEYAAENRYLAFFDEQWYEEQYLTSDLRLHLRPLDHYLSVGWRKHYLPFRFFDIDKFYSRFSKCYEEPLSFLFYNRISEYFFTESAIPKMQLNEKAGVALQELYRIRQEELIKKELPIDNDINKVMIIIVSPEDAISGGIMSFYGIYYLSQKLKGIHHRKVLAVSIPGDTTHAGFTMFKNDMPVFRYDMVVRRLHHVQDVLIMLPETYVMTYLQYIQRNTEDPLLNTVTRQLNILNQKIEIMPEPRTIQALKCFFPNLTQTVAHYKYCTAKERDYYGIPMQLLLPPIIKNFEIVPYEKKEDIFAYSYDEKPWKSKLLRKLQEAFPNYQFVEIKGLMFDEYLELIKRAKWCMTFGEGLDGYFSEPYQMGGISFAVWNDEYFTERYRALPTVLSDENDALQALIPLIRKLDNKEDYESTSAMVRKVHGEEYATKRTSEDQLRDFFLKRYDFP